MGGFGVKDAVDVFGVKDAVDVFGVKGRVPWTWKRC